MFKSLSQGDGYRSSFTSVSLHAFSCHIVCFYLNDFYNGKILSKEVEKEIGPVCFEFYPT